MYAILVGWDLEVSCLPVSDFVVLNLLHFAHLATYPDYQSSMIMLMVLT